MEQFFADLHIHVGRNKYGKPVKITGAKSLTITNILKEASDRKGINIVGVIDCHAPSVLEELEDSINSGIAVEEVDGGIRYKNTTLFLGSEIEIYDHKCQGPIHVLCYFPAIKIMKQFTDWLSHHMKNIELSSQRYYGTAIELQEKVKELDGIFIPAHIFTPFKSTFGKGVKRSMGEVFNTRLVDGVELGLSSDTYMADQIKELHAYPFLTNSDAHSLGKIGREYQLLEMEAPTFSEWKKVLHHKGNRKIVANYGMHPKLGKYYATVCKNCLSPVPHESPCPVCGSSSVIRGVSDRINELASNEPNPNKRPPYIYQVPLEYIPGLGKKTFEKLLDHFHNEMNIIHYVPYDHLKDVVGDRIANSIMNIRNGVVEIEQGGGGKYGKWLS
ncbi:TIGR00375 family protein [Gracilibacillus ureilyticus]|uniref:TIGR00375 family protein n=1 Tax=Gracilibacillus ureilyticus TaxID=531814 RepID=A0A1H9LU37_9BACI|nr:endonuclease Q family protein [Gracilibacillus ureilyticus]SER15042.1 TIGR00375 family protein [Gracilibacillus ureilyticus]